MKYKMTEVPPNNRAFLTPGQIKTKREEVLKANAAANSDSKTKPAPAPAPEEKKAK